MVIFPSLVGFAAKHDLHPICQVGGIEMWNQSHADVKQLSQMLLGMCKATNVPEALMEVPWDSYIGSAKGWCEVCEKKSW